MGGRLGVGRREDAQHRREGYRGAVGSEAGQWQSHHGKRGLGGHGAWGIQLGMTAWKRDGNFQCLKKIEYNQGENC